MTDGGTQTQAFDRLGGYQSEPFGGAVGVNGIECAAQNIIVEVLRQNARPQQTIQSGFIRRGGVSFLLGWDGHQPKTKRYLACSRHSASLHPELAYKAT
jgi:hypothetical protein